MTTIARVWTCFAAVVSPAPILIEAMLPRKSPVVYGEPRGDRTIFVVLSKLCICVLSGLVGHRIHLLSKSANRLTLTQIYIFALYTFSIGFVFSAAVVNNGLGLTTDGSCKASVMLCLMFYAASKVSMYLFLVERAHILRALYAPRHKDLLWLLSTIAIVVCLGAICIAGIVSPKYVLSEVDGRCRIGLQRYAAIPLLTCDIVINLYLTTVFIYLLSPLVKDNTSSGTGVVNRVTLCISKTLGRVQQKATMDLHRSNKALVKRVETLLQKTLIGCVLVILPTGGNLAAICILVGKELAFICLTLCTFDVTWAAIVFHWLTIVGTDENEGATPAQVSPKERNQQLDRVLTDSSPQSRQSGSQQPGIPLQPQTEPLRKKPTLLTPTDLDLLSIDAKDDGGTKTTNKFDFGLSQTATPSHCGPSSQTESHWRDSGHSTLVSDTNMSNNAVNSR